MSKYEWFHIYTLHGGLKIFRDGPTGRLALADQSGYTPDQTDDGVLWIDLASWAGIDENGRVVIPLIKEENGGRAYAVTDVRSLPRLMNVGLSIELGDGHSLYAVSLTEK